MGTDAFASLVTFLFSLERDIKSFENTNIMKGAMKKNMLMFASLNKVLVKIALLLYFRDAAEKHCYWTGGGS